MINATGSTPSPIVTPMNSGRPPVASPAMNAGASAPRMATPKKKFNIKMVMGLLGFGLLLAGAVAAYMLVFNPADLRQQADVVDPGIGSGVCGGPKLPSGNCGPTQENTESGSCVNSCRCGYVSGACGNKPDGGSCYRNEQCQSGRCDGGVSGNSSQIGTCSSTSPSNPPLSEADQCTQSNGYLNQAQAETACAAIPGNMAVLNWVGSTQCYRCQVIPSIQAGQTCSAMRCYCIGGPSNGQTVVSGATCPAATANGCFGRQASSGSCSYFTDCVAANIPVAQRFATQQSCDDYYASGGNVSSCTSQAFLETELWRGDHTNACTDSGTVKYQCDSGYAPHGYNGKTLCLSSSYSAAKKTCISAYVVNRGSSESQYNQDVVLCNGNTNTTWSDNSCSCENDVTTGPTVGPCCVRATNGNLEYRSTCSAPDRVAVPSSPGQCSATANGCDGITNMEQCAAAGCIVYGGGPLRCGFPNPTRSCFQLANGACTSVQVPVNEACYEPYTTPASQCPNNACVLSQVSGVVVQGNVSSGGCAYVLQCDFNGDGGYEFSQCTNTVTGSQATSVCQSICPGNRIPTGGVCVPGTAECSGTTGQGRMCETTGQWSALQNMHACGYVGGPFSCTNATRRFIGCGSQACGSGYVNCYEGCSNGQPNCQVSCVCEPNLSCGQPGARPGNNTPGTTMTCSSPNPSTPPSNPPQQQLSCARMEMLDATGTTVLTTTPPTGTQVRFRCVGTTPSNYFFFAYRDTNEIDPLRLIYEGTSDLTFPITLQPFTTVQCNPCVAGVGCSDSASVQSNCTFQVDRRTTSPSPTPSPVGPQCLSISMTNVTNPTAPATADPRLGDAVTFTCGEVAGASRYLFRVQNPNGTTSMLSATGRTSSQLVISEAGRYYAQCQICTGADDASCMPFESLPADEQGGI